MQHYPGSDQAVECSGLINLGCECGERLTLLGLEEDWHSEKRTEFECSCGKSLSLLGQSQLAEDVRALRRLHRGTFY